MYVCTYIYIYTGVDQTKRYLGQLQSDQPQINRDPNGANRGRILSYATLFCAEDRQNIATYCSIYRHCVSQGLHMAGLTIAEQSRTNRGFHRHFLKIELIWVVRL